LPVTVLIVDVTVTDPPDASVESCPAVSVAVWTWFDVDEDVYTVSAGCIWSDADTPMVWLWAFTTLDVLEISATADGLVGSLPHPTT